MSSSARSSLGADDGLRLRASAELELRKRQRRACGLLDYVPRLSPGFVPPCHLAPVARLYERIAAGECVRAVVSCPPRHGKTELEMHGTVWLLDGNPALEIGFVGYGAAFARKKSRRMRDLARRAGVPSDPRAKSVSDWRTGVETGGLWATSVGGAVTGEGFHVLLIDDPVKGRREAESAVYREGVLERLRADLITRLHPGGSCIITQTRWHVDDPAGVMLREGWESVCLPAVDDRGHALWPERYDVPALEAIRKTIGEYNWASLYQGSPVPRGGALFSGVTTYRPDGLPRAMRKAIGLDFAYSAKTSSDYSVAVVVGYADGVFYVLDVLRMQARATEFGRAVARLREAHPLAPLYATIGGTEIGVVDLLGSSDFGVGLPIEWRTAVGDKFVRAQATAADWNACKIALPEDASAHPWVRPFVDELCGFTGVADVHDDQVDALGTAVDFLREGVGVGDFLLFGTR